MRLIALLLLFVGTAIGQNSILWQITGEGVKDTSYLYGTIHFPNKKFFYVNPKVHEIKRKVDAGVFEIKLSQDSLAFLTYALMAKDGQQISQICTAEEKQLIFDYFKDNLGMENLFVDRLIPMALATTVLQVYFKSDTTGAIDSKLQEDFARLGKPVLALESIAFQSELFTSIPIEEQKSELLEMLGDLDSLQQSIHDLDSVYMNQDLNGISGMLDDMDPDKVFNKAVLNDNRNLKMMEKIPGIMKRHSALICVGAAHLGGESGLIALLRKNGYTVEAVLN